MLPVVILAFFPVDDLPLKEYSVFPAMLIGLLLYGLVYAIRKALIRKRLGRLDNDSVNVNDMWMQLWTINKIEFDFYKYIVLWNYLISCNIRTASQRTDSLRNK